MQSNLDQVIGQSNISEQSSWTAPLTPTEVAERESFLPLMPPDQSVRWLSVGASLVEICPAGVDELESLMICKEDGEAGVNGGEYEKYILKVLPSADTGSDDGAVQLTFFEGASDDDLLKGMFHAYAAHECMRNRVVFREETSAIVDHSYAVVNSQMTQFMSHLEERGWQMETGFVNVECGSSFRLKIEDV